MQTHLQDKAIAHTHMRYLAERLIAHEAGGKNKSSATRTATMFPVSESLRLPLAALVGGTGFAAMMSRALILASAKAAWLRGVHVNADGSLEGVAGLERQVAPKQLVEGRVVLLTCLLELLDSFIGENLTLQIVRDIWPTLFPNDSGIGD